MFAVHSNRYWVKKINYNVQRARGNEKHVLCNRIQILFTGLTFSVRPP